MRTWLHAIPIAAALLTACGLFGDDGSLEPLAGTYLLASCTSAAGVNALAETNVTHAPPCIGSEPDFTKRVLRATIVLKSDGSGSWVMTERESSTQSQVTFRRNGAQLTMQIVNLSRTFEWDGTDELTLRASRPSSDLVLRRVRAPTTGTYALAGCGIIYFSWEFYVQFDGIACPTSIGGHSSSTYDSARVVVESTSANWTFYSTQTGPGSFTEITVSSGSGTSSRRGSDTVVVNGSPQAGALVFFWDQKDRMVLKTGSGHHAYFALQP